MPRKPIKHIEDAHQKALFNWAKCIRLNALQVQCASSMFLADVMYAIPNGGKRNEREGARLKAQGVRAGIPDICIPISASNFNSLYIELKKPLVATERNKPRVTQVQKDMIKKLRACGNCVMVCYGFDEAVECIKAYLNHTMTPSYVSTTD